MGFGCHSKLIIGEKHSYNFTWWCSKDVQGQVSYLMIPINPLCTVRCDNYIYVPSWSVSDSEFDFPKSVSSFSAVLYRWPTGQPSWNTFYHQNVQGVRQPSSSCLVIAWAQNTPIIRRTYELMNSWSTAPTWCLCRDSYISKFWTKQWR